MKLKKIFAMLLCVLLLATSIPLSEPVYAADTITGTTTWGNLSEVKSASALYINTDADWNKFANLSVKSGLTFAGQTVYLCANITLSGATETVKNFKGSFNGQGFTMSISGNLTNSGDVMDWAIGLFRIVSGSGNIENLDVKLTNDLGVPNNAGDTKTTYAGVIAGLVETTRGITNCSVRSDDPNSPPKFYDNFVDRENPCHIGAVAGLVKSGSISGCYADIRVHGQKEAYSGSNISVGGIAGCILGSSSISNCLVMTYNNGGASIYAQGGSKQNANAGGIVGWIYSGSPRVSNNYVAGANGSKQVKVVPVGANVNGGCIVGNRSNTSNVTNNWYNNASQGNGLGAQRWDAGSGSAETRLGSAWIDVQGDAKATLRRLAVTTTITPPTGGAEPKVYSFSADGATTFGGSIIYYTGAAPGSRQEDQITADTISIPTGGATLTPDTEISLKVWYKDDAYSNRFSVVATYSTKTAKMPQPYFNPGSGDIIDPSLGVSILCDNRDARIVYVLDSSTAGDITLKDKLKSSYDAIDFSDAAVKQFSTAIPFPENQDRFTIYARAYAAPGDTITTSSEVSTITYTAGGNKPQTAAPTLLMKPPTSTGAKVTFNPGSVYDPGTEVYFSHANMSSGSFYYTIDGTQPTMDSNMVPGASAGTQPFLKLDKLTSSVEVKVFLGRSYEPNSLVGEYTISVRSTWGTPAGIPESTTVPSGTEVKLAPNLSDMEQPAADGIPGFSESTPVEISGDGSLAGTNPIEWLKTNLVDGRLMNTVVLDSMEKWEEVKDVYRHPPWVYYVMGDPAAVESQNPSGGNIYKPASPNVLVRSYDSYVLVNLAVTPTQTPIMIEGMPEQQLAIKAMVKNNPTSNIRADSDVWTYRYTIRKAPGVITAIPKPTDSNNEITVIAPGTNITLYCPTAATTIFYTTDGTVPQVVWNKTDKKWEPVSGNSAMKYESPIRAGRTSNIFTIYALAVSTANVLEAGTMQNFSYRVSDLPMADMPTAYPETKAPNYTQLLDGDTISLRSTDIGSRVYFTTDGSAPNPKAYDDWVAAGSDPTDVPATKLYSEGSVKAVFHERTTGSDGSQTVTLKSNTFTVIAVSTGDDYKTSAPAQFIYQLAKAEAPTAMPETSQSNVTTLGKGTMITLTTPTTGAAIYYTLDNTMPVVADADKADRSTKTYVPSKGILMPDTSFLNIRALTHTPATGTSTRIYRDSDPVHFTYRMSELTVAAMPTAYPETNAPSYTQLLDGDSISLRSSDIGSRVYFTTDGSAPNPRAYDDWVAAGSDPATVPATKLYSEGSVKAVFHEYTTGADGSQTAKLKSSTFTVIAVSTGDDYRTSAPAQFVYQLAKAEAPTAMPTTSQSKVTTVAQGAMITLTTPTPGADIYYTIDNTMPVVADADKTGKSTKTYVPSKGILMPDTSFLNIRAIAHTPLTAGNGIRLYSDSDPAHFTYQTPAALQAVYTTPGAGMVEANTKITLKTSAQGARIFYRVFDTEPAESDVITPNKDPLYDEQTPIIITKETWIMALSELNGAKSNTTVYHFEVAPTLSKPEASVDTGTTVAKGTQISLTSTEDATIVYTKDGSDPKDAANKALFYGSEVVIDAEYGASVTIKAYASGANFTPSDVASFSYSILKEGEDLKVVPASGAVVKNGSTISISTALSDATIYYTTNTEQPTTSSSTGNTITVSGNPGESFVVKVLLQVGENSVEKTFTYTLMALTPSPKANIPSGSVTLDGAKVELSAPEGKIYYTTDSTNPTSNSLMYTAPIDASKTMVLKAIAIADGKESSDIVEYTYTRADQAAAPTFSITSGEIVLKTAIEIASLTEDAQIYYTTDGTDPKADNLSACVAYSGPVTITRPVTIKAIAVKEKMHSSLINTATYTVVEPPPPEEDTGNAEIPKITSLDRLVSRRDYNDETAGPTFTDIILSDPPSNIVVGANSGVIPKETKLSITQVEGTASDTSAVNALLGYNIMSLYDVSLELDGVFIQPEGEVELGLPIPPECSNAVIVVCSIGDDGSVEAFPTRRTGNIAYIKTSHFSKYAVTAPVVIENGGIDQFIIIALVVLAAMLLSGVILFVLRLTRKSRERHGRNNVKS